MKSTILYLLLLTMAATAAPAFAGQPERPKAGKETTADVVSNMLIVKLKHEPSLLPGAVATGVRSLDMILQRINATGVEALHASPSLKKNASPEARSIARIMVLRYDADVDPYTLAKEVALDPAVEYAEPVINFQALYTPDDPRLNQQWALSMMNMFDAWDITKGDSTIVIGFVDTGVNYTHEDLAQSLWINPGEWGVNGELANNGIDDDNNGYIDDWRGWDFIGNGTAQQPNPNNNPMDFNGHGTNGASIAAARTDNGLGIAGIGFHTKLLAIKVQDDAGQGGFYGYPGILYAADMGCKVINCSWGGNAFISQAMQDVIDYARSKGALVVGGAGNNLIDNDEMPFLPANLRHVLSVSSQEPDGTASNWAAYGSSIGIFAPGKDVLSARGGFGYQNVTGTSFAAPMMSDWRHCCSVSIPIGRRIRC
jgi:serine protease